LRRVGAVIAIRKADMAKNINVLSISCQRALMNLAR
jgi:hypothetical protein